MLCVCCFGILLVALCILQRAEGRAVQREGAAEPWVAELCSALFRCRNSAAHVILAFCNLILQSLIGSIAPSIKFKICNFVQLGPYPNFNITLVFARLFILVPDP